MADPSSVTPKGIGASEQPQLRPWSAITTAFVTTYLYSTLLLIMACVALQGFARVLTGISPPDVILFPPEKPPQAHMAEA